MNESTQNIFKKNEENRQQITTITIVRYMSHLNEHKTERKLYKTIENYYNNKKKRIELISFFFESRFFLMPLL